VSSLHLCARAEEPCPRKHADAHGVDEAIVAIRLVEDRFAAHGRHADGVPVGTDPGYGALELPARLGEPQRVEERDRPRPHGHDVSQDASDARCCALKGLDGRRVVVRLDLEGDGFAFAEIDHTGVLTGALQHPFSSGRKAPQEESRVLVAAVFRPEQREDCELEVVRVALEQPPDAVELLVGQPQRTVERLFRRDLRQGSESILGRRRVAATFPFL
jgi:hypothetical protein